MNDIQLPPSTVKKIERVMCAISEKEARELLNVKQSTFANYLLSGRIPSDTYTIGVGGKRFFDKSKLIGLK